MSVAVKGPCDEAILRSAAPSPCDRATARWVLAATILGSSMAFLDGSVINVALPVLQEKLAASVSSAQWVVEAYLLLLSSLVLTGGSLGDRYGRRRVFSIGAVLFALSSAAGGFAPNISWLIGARAVQGIGAALLVPTSLAILGASFAASERGRAVGTWSALTTLSSAVGPVFGGWLIQISSWRAVFFVNLPMAAAVLAIAWTKIPEGRGSKLERLDLPGALLAVVGLGGMIFGLIEAPDAGWSAARCWIPLTTGLAALCVLALVERRSRHPMIPPRLFGSRAFAGANLLTLFLYAALSAAFFFLPFDLIQARGYSPAAAGAALLPLVFVVTALSRWAGGISDRFGPRLPLIVGPSTVAAGFLLLAFSGRQTTYAISLLPALAVAGLGLAVTVAPLTATVLNAVERERQGTASGINNAVARVAGLLAIAAVGIAFSLWFDHTLDRRLSQSGFSEPLRIVPETERKKLGAAQPPSHSTGMEARGVRSAVASSLHAAFRFAMGISAALALLAAAMTALFIENPATRLGIRIKAA